MAEALQAQFRLRWAVVAGILLALWIVPAPLLPPHRLAEALQSALGIGWKAAYLVAAVGLRGVFYGSLGALASLAVTRASTPRGRALQLVVLPLLVIGVALLVRTVKLGHLPVLAHVLLPACACAAGAVLALGVAYRGWRLTLAIAAAGTVLASWGLLGGVSGSLSRATEARLRALVAAAPGLPRGDARLGELTRAAFAPLPDGPESGSAVHRNRASILALGILSGDERLARQVGLDPAEELVRSAAALRPGTTLRGREDWARHFTVSAALAILESPALSDAAGLIKEELDALTHGSGFSFDDLAADRAGVRFAEASTSSTKGAEAMRLRLQGAVAVDDFFPPAADLPENLTVDEFRSAYGSVGSPRFREAVAALDARLDRCAALAAP